MTGECLRKDDAEGQANKSTGTEFGPIGSVRDRWTVTWLDPTDTSAWLGALIVLILYSVLFAYK